MSRDLQLEAAEKARRQAIEHGFENPIVIVSPLYPAPERTVDLDVVHRWVAEYVSDTMKHRGKK